MLLCCLAAFLSLSPFFSEGFSSSLTVSLSGQGCHTTDRHHKESEGRKKNPLCSQPAEVVIDGTLNKNRGRKAHFLPSCGRQKPLSWRGKKKASAGTAFLSKSSIYSFKHGGSTQRRSLHSTPLRCHRAIDTHSRCLFSNNRRFSSSDDHSHQAALMALCCICSFASNIWRILQHEY